MLTIKRKCVLAQVVFSLYDGEEWVDDLNCPPLRLTASQEGRLTEAVDRLLDTMVAEMNAKGQAVRRGDKE